MNGPEHIVEQCLERSRKNVLIVYDDTTEQVYLPFAEAMRRQGKHPTAVRIPISERHGEEPPKQIAEQMRNSDAIMCLTRYSLAHTQARRDSEELGIPFLSMPDYDAELLNNAALSADYRGSLRKTQKYAQMLTDSKTVEIRTELGTELYMDISGRAGNCCPGLVNARFLLGSPPDIEANIAPIEHCTKGTIVVDGSITDRRIGLLKHPVTLRVEDGSVCEIASADRGVAHVVEEIFRDVGSEKAYVIGELGIGLNDEAMLCGNMLVDEGTAGCVHFGIGSNWTIGGKNRVDFHLDFVIRAATLKLDGIPVMERGKLLYGSL